MCLHVRGVELERARLARLVDDTHALRRASEPLLGVALVGALDGRTHEGRGLLQPAIVKSNVT
jgi:hypothetical protein